MKLSKNWLLDIENQHFFQKLRFFSHLLSSVIMPNISIFIAWGLFSLILPLTTGDLHSNLQAISSIVIGYLLPLLVAYTGGKNMGGDKGGVVGALSALGIIIDQETPQLFAAILIGLLTGFAYGYFEKKILSKVHSGYTMLLKNYLSALFGVAFCFASMFILSPLIHFVTDYLVWLMSLIIQQNLLPLTSILIEPLKILFFNNAINHGLLLPLGMQMSADSGKSILFLLEANPGPGLGVLLAYFFFDKKRKKMDISAAMMIQAIGGIHEIYFPFVLSNPLLFLAVIFGGMSGVLVFSLQSIGLSMPASPGSLLVLLSAVSRHDIFGLLLGVSTSTIVSFIIAGLVVSKGRIGEVLMDEEVRSQPKSIIKEIIFACDAGMGSSAMAQGLFSKMLKEKGVALPISYSSVHKLNGKKDVLIVTYPKFVQSAIKSNPESIIAPMENFLETLDYERIYEQYLLGLEKKENQVFQEVAPQKTWKIRILYRGNIRGSQTMAVEKLSELLKNRGIQADVAKESMEEMVSDQATFYIIDEKLVGSGLFPLGVEHLYVVENLVTCDYEDLLKSFM